MESYLKQLEGLGLSDKEAKVYLASLELGSATAQQIAAKAAVVRPTAYVAIGGLVKRGLVSSFTKGKKQYFTAEKPDQLMRLVQDEKKKIVEQEEKLKAILPGLSSLISLTGEKPEVKFYEGLEGLEAMRKLLIGSRTKTLDVISTPHFEKVVPEESSALHDFRLGQMGLKARVIQVSDKGKAKNRTQQKGKSLFEFRYIPVKNIKDYAEIAIFGDNVSIVSYLDKPHGFLIKSKHAANTARVMFDAIWTSLKI
jgi:sugar-specific transcriptional regulator TrmB